MEKVINTLQKTRITPKKLADRLIVEAYRKGIYKPNVTPVEEIAGCLGIKIKTTDSPEQYTGLIINDNGSVMMTVDNGLSPDMRRIAVAKRLGAYLLSDTRRECTGRDVEHFAKSLLMPMRNVVADWNSMDGKLTYDERAERIAADFGVTALYAKKRLRGIGIPEN